MKKPSKDAFSTIAGAIAGAVVGKMAVKMIPIENGLIKALIPIGAGLFLSGNKNPMIKGLGYGMAASGGLTLVDALAPGMLGAPIDEEIFLGEVEELGEYEEINDPADQSLLSDPADQSLLSEPADQSILSSPGAYNEAAEQIASAFDMEE